MAVCCLKVPTSHLTDPVAFFKVSIFKAKMTSSQFFEHFTFFLELTLVPHYSPAKSTDVKSPPRERETDSAPRDT